uniref:Uncharacterized protein n=1 Tax=Oryza rufipogon TaxID=4529 RepID=A0A0E0Q148_ORYRU
MPTGYDATEKTWARGIALCARETADAACARERKPGGGQWARGIVLWERETERDVAIRVRESEERGGAALLRFEGARPSDVPVCARETVGESECMEGAAVGSVSRYARARPPSVSCSACARASPLFSIDTFRKTEGSELRRGRAREERRQCMQWREGKKDTELNFEAAIVIRASWLKRSRRYLINAGMSAFRVYFSEGEIMENESGIWKRSGLTRCLAKRSMHDIVQRRYMMEILALV